MSKNKKLKQDIQKRKETREDYRAWRDSPSTVRERDKSITISPKMDRRRKIGKRKHEGVEEGSKREKRMSEYAIKQNRKYGGKKTLLESKPGGRVINTGLSKSGITRPKNTDPIKEKKLFDQMIRRKKEKGVVRKEYDPNWYEPSEKIAGMNVSKHDTMWDKDGEIPRDQRKYVAQGIDEEGDPIKEKYKRKRVRGKDFTERGLHAEDKWKRKRVRTSPKGDKKQYYEQKYVDFEDCKRIKKRGSSERDARRYVRKGLRRQYIDPDKEGKFHYVGTGEEVGKKPRKEKKRKNGREYKVKEEKINKTKTVKPTKEEKKSARQQKRKERETRRRQAERDLAESSGGGYGYGASSSYNDKYI